VKVAPIDENVRLLYEHIRQVAFINAAPLSTAKTGDPTKMIQSCKKSAGRPLQRGTLETVQKVRQEVSTQAGYSRKRQPPDGKVQAVTAGSFDAGGRPIMIC
jgi:hypothetical protein